LPDKLGGHSIRGIEERGWNMTQKDTETLTPGQTTADQADSEQLHETVRQGDDPALLAEQAQRDEERADKVREEAGMTGVARTNRLQPGAQPEEGTPLDPATGQPSEDAK
jgi:hypothetical protein